MQNKYVFNKVCKKDIKEIYDIVKEYLPLYEINYLTQSVIYEKDKKIIFKTIKDAKKDIIGKEILIEIYNKETFIINTTENSICIRISNGTEEKLAKIKLKDNIITRYFLYSNPEVENHSEEKYLIKYNDFREYNNSESIITCIDKLKPKNKTRKRS